MKNIILILFVISLSEVTLSQSLLITKTDQSTISFKLADVDSITFSVTSLGKSSDLPNDKVSNTISANEETSAANKSIDKGTDEKSKRMIQEDLEKSTSGSITYYKKE